MKIKKKYINQTEIISFSGISWTVCFLMILGFSPCNSQIQLNEFLASNLTVNYDENGEDDDWIELKNVGSDVVSTAGFWLGDSENEPVKWSLPVEMVQAGEKLLVWCDKDEEQGPWHSNFKLNKGGGCIYLGAGNTIVDQICYAEQRTNYSYGRAIDQDVWLNFEQATPKEENSKEGKNGFAPDPISSHDQAYYQAPFLLELSAEENGQIRYEIGGKKPDSNSEIYTEAILVNSSTVVRFFAELENKYDSRIVTKTFVFEEEKELPSVFVAMNPDDLFHPSFGIYAEGNNFFLWERENNVSFFEDNETRFQLDAGIAISGGSTRNNPQKSFNINTKAKFGAKKLNYQLFEESQRDEYEGFRMRISGNDNDRAMFRDALMQELVDSSFNFTQGYRPMVLFLNGEYWGIYNIREKHRPHFFKEKYQLEVQDLIEQSGKAKIGDTLFYGEVKRFFRENDFQETAKYDSALQLIDVDNFIDYYVAQIYYANTDWLDNNTKIFREPNGKLKWVIFDTDLGFAFAPRWGHPGGVDHNTLLWAMNCCEEANLHNSPKSTVIFRGFMANPEFRQQFLKRFNYHLNHTFCPERVIEKIDKMAARLESEIPYQVLRWVDEIGDLATWHENVEVLRDFARRRPQIVVQHLIDYYGLITFDEPEIFTYPLDGGTVSITWNYEFDSSHGGACSQELFGPSALQLQAQEASGFAFESWSSGLGNQAELEWDWSGNSSLTALFSESGSDSPDELLRIFPNPCSDVLHLQALQSAGEGSEQVGSLRIVDAFGRLVWQAVPVDSYFFHEKIDLHNWPSGLYWLQYEQSGEILGASFLKH